MADSQPAWSPDGRQIHFNSTRDGQNALYVMNRDGGGVRRITNDSWDNVDGSWALGGLAIIYKSYRTDGAYLIIVRPDGSIPTLLTKTPADQGHPSWWGGY
jgi:TolB protein